MGHWQDSGPSDNGVACTTSDTAQQPVGRELYVGTGGTVIARPSNGAADLTFKNVASGARLPYSFLFIRATGTTAADMVIMF